MMKALKKICSLLALTGMLILLLGASASARTYYTGNKLKTKTSAKVRIISIKGNTVTYRKVTLVANDYYVDYKMGKAKKAKLTSKTKYYFGDYDRYVKLLRKSNYKKNQYTLKWIYKVSKSTFVKKRPAGGNYWDQIQVKNGKVVRIFTRMQIAG